MSKRSRIQENPKEKKVMENAFIYQDLEEKMKECIWNKSQYSIKRKGKR